MCQLHSDKANMLGVPRLELMTTTQLVEEVSYGSATREGRLYLDRSINDSLVRIEYIDALPDDISIPSLGVLIDDFA